MRSAGLSNLYIPKELKIIDEFPILGSGKLDLKKLQEIAES
jgi:non-ribosomal peptide synthetase component E (peptide arylation enzyme)